MYSLRLLASCLLLFSLVGCSGAIQGAESEDKNVEPSSKEQKTEQTESSSEKQKPQEKEEVQKEDESNDEQVKEESEEKPVENAEEPDETKEEAKNEEGAETEETTTEAKESTEDKVAEQDEEIETTQADNNQVAEEPAVEEPQEEATNRIVEQQMDTIENQLINSGYPALENWNILSYRQLDMVATGTYESSFSYGNATISLYEYGEEIVQAAITLPSTDQASYDEAYTLLRACMTNVYFTSSEVDQIISQLQNGEDIVYVNGLMVSLTTDNGLQIIGGKIGG